MLSDECKASEDDEGSPPAGVSGNTAARIMLTVLSMFDLQQEQHVMML